jgi:putative membrane-bound dehydrogenase-like protein
MNERRLRFRARNRKRRSAETPMSQRRILLALFLLAIPSVLAAADVRSPLTPKEAQKLFRLPPGLRIELVASEPQIESPVAMAFDEDGKLWVVEMRDYPHGPKPGEKAQGRIKVLEDRDGDGFYETATVYADNLLFANGVLPWKGGAVVTMAPKIVYIKDGKTEVLYEGFSAGNPQLRVSHPVLGLDGWVYVANGLRGGKVKKAGDPGAKAIDLSGRDFRFNLLTGQYEALSGMGQYGNCFDDWGNRFVCDNRHHLRHVVIEDRYLKRNPFLAAPAVVQDISSLDDEEGPLSSGGRVYPISKNWTTSALHVGRFTAACGVHIYGGDLLPKEYRGCAFTCEPTGNLVHQEVLTPQGATFRSKPAKEGVEFLASTDDWFRPVFLSGGPDGALYIVDMYRAVIEHPEWMPPELKNRPDIRWGRRRGESGASCRRRAESRQRAHNWEKRIITTLLACWPTRTDGKPWPLTASC